MKRCTRCGEEKDESAFSPHTQNGKTKLRPECKPCRVAYQRAYVAANKDRIAASRRERNNRPDVKAKRKAYAAEHYQQNKTQLRENQKQYRKQNKDMLYEGEKAWRTRNADRDKATRAAWRKRHYAKNAAKYAEQYKALSAEHPERFATYSARAELRRICKEPDERLVQALTYRKLIRKHLKEMTA